MVQFGLLPISKHSHHTPINEIMIDSQDKLYRKWIATLTNNYRSFPFLMKSCPSFSKVYSSNFSHLSEFNVALLKEMLSYLEIESNIILASELDLSYDCKTDMHIKLIQSVNATSYLSGPSGKEYIDFTRWNATGLKILFHNYTPVPYSHIYDQHFALGLSAIDSMMMLGKDSKHVIIRN